MRNRDVNRDHPRARRPSDHRERLWDRARKIAAPSAIFFPKPESDFAALGRRGAFPLGHTISVIGGNSEASALREFASAIIERAELPVQKEHVEWLIGHDMIKAPLAH